MAEINFSFENRAGVSAALTYAREPDGGRRLSLRFSSDRIRRPGGEPKGFALDFNAIGKGHPLSFLLSLDQGYLNDKIGALTVQQHDLFATIENVRRVVQSPDAEQTADQIEEVERRIDAAARDFTGDHGVSSQMLIGALNRMDLPGFQDDAYHLVGMRRTHENRAFETGVRPLLRGDPMLQPNDLGRGAVPLPLRVPDRFSGGVPRALPGAPGPESGRAPRTSSEGDRGLC